MRDGLDGDMSTNYKTVYIKTFLCKEYSELLCAMLLLTLAIDLT